MRHLSKLLATVMVLAACGCAHTLEEGGPYESVAVYDADLSIVTSWDICQLVMEWELENRASLSKYPEIGRITDQIREKAPSAHLRALRLTEVYNASLTDVDKTAAERAVTALRGIAVEALGVMTEFGL